MPKLFLLSLLFLSVSFSGLGQKLKYGQLLKLHKMEKQEMGRFLQKKGWTLNSDGGPTAEMLGKAVWAYNPKGTNAIAWCILYYNDSNPNRILYNSTGSSDFQKIRRKVEKRSTGFLQAKSPSELMVNVADYSDYESGDLVIRLLTYTQPDYFGVKIFSKEDYLKAKQNDRL